MTVTQRFFQPLPTGTTLVVSHGFQKNYERGYCNGLAAAGVRFVLVSSDQTDRTGLSNDVVEINLRGSQSAARSRWTKAWNLLRYHALLMLFVAWHRPAAVHVIGLIEPTWLCGELQGRWFRCFGERYLLTVHNTERHDQGGDKNRSRYLRSFRWAHHLIVHTQRLRSQLHSSNLLKHHPITVMEHGFEPMVAMPVFAPRTALSHTRPLRLLMFGYVMRYKGHEVLLEALEQVDFPFALTIAGECADSAWQQALKTRIADHPKAAHIQWENGFVSEDRMEALFREADALVLPYRRIDQSGVLLQAFRWGLPVIASRVGAFEDYVTEEWGELCEPGDVPSLRDALTRMAGRADRIDRAALWNQARRFEWVHTVAAIRPLLEQAAPKT